MASDNILAAPTEGLGQTVTFAFQPGNYGAAQAAGSPGTLRAGVSESGRASPTLDAAGAPSGPADSTLTRALMGLLDASAKKEIKQRQTEAFLTGMQRAAAGEAVADIAKDQPWYSTLFGEADAVEGARAYTGVAVANAAVTALEDSMPELRKLAPDAARSRMVEQINASMTGDTASDMAVMQHLTSALPSLMRRHVKEHYGYVQETASAAEKAAFDSWAGRLQATGSGLATGTVSQEEFDGVLSGFKLGVIPVDGRDPKNYTDSMASNIVGWAKAGKLHAVAALEKSGFFEALSPEQRARVETARNVGEVQVRDTYSAKWVDDIVKIKSDAAMPEAGTSTADLRDRIQALNARYAAESGATNGLFSTNEVGALLTRNALEIRQAHLRQAEEAQRTADRLSRQGDTAAAEASKQANIMTMYRSGAATEAKASFGADMDRVIANAAREYNNNPEGLATFLSQGFDGGYTNPIIKGALVGTVNKALKGGNFDDFLPVFQQYKELRKLGARLADDYYGPYAAQLEGVYQDDLLGIPAAGSFVDNMLQTKRVRLDRKEAAEALKVVNAEHNSFLPSWARTEGVNFKPGQAQRLVGMLADDAERFKASNNLDTKDAMMRAWSVRQRAGVEAVGGYVWANTQGQKSVEDFLTRTPGKTLAVNKVHKIVADYIAAQLKPAGIDPDAAHSIAMVRLPDKDGAPAFGVHVMSDTYEVKNVPISFAGIFEFSKQISSVEHVPRGNRGQPLR